MKTPRQPGRQQGLLTIPDHWTPEIALAVFEMIDDLRDQIWSQYAGAIQEELRRQLEPDPIPDNMSSPRHDI